MRILLVASLLAAGCVDSSSAPSVCPANVGWQASPGFAIPGPDGALYGTTSTSFSRFDAATGAVTWSVTFPENGVLVGEIGADAAGNVTVATADGLAHYPKDATAPDWVAPSPLGTSRGELRVTPEGDVLLAWDLLTTDATGQHESLEVTAFADGAVLWDRPMLGTPEEDSVAVNLVDGVLHVATQAQAFALDPATGASVAPAIEVPSGSVAVADGFAFVDPVANGSIALVDAQFQRRGTIAAFAPDHVVVRALGRSLDGTQLVVAYDGREHDTEDGQVPEISLGFLIADGKTGAVARSLEGGWSVDADPCFVAVNADTVTGSVDGGAIASEVDGTVQMTW